MRKGAMLTGGNLHAQRIRAVHCENFWVTSPLKTCSTYFCLTPKCQLDPIDEAQIEILCRRPCFTPRQKQALAAMEEIYQVKS